CFKQKTAYEVLSLLEFRRVLFRSIGVNPPAYTIGNWHLLVGTYDGVSRRVYVDGAAVGLRSTAGSSSGATVSQIDMGIINENTRSEERRVGKNGLTKAVAGSRRNQ